MRWNGLRTDVASGDDLALFGAESVVARTFDTPDFAGMTFYEVRARSIINRVPAASRVPFSWTINPYRGCSHACVYCLDGATEVSMIDGSSRPIADLAVGDEIFGTVRYGARRRLVRTQVLARWPSRKRAYQIRLADDTRLIASADHRFLTTRGWKQVAPGERPVPSDRVLAPADTLLGVDSSPTIGGVLGPRHQLTVHRVQDLRREQEMYDITTGTGDFLASGVVAHNCFARRTHEYLELDSGHDFDSQVVVKVNAAELLRRELASPRWSGEHIAMGTNVDCYQRAEGRYRLMPEIIDALDRARNPFSILTKGTLVLRDLDQLARAARRTEVSVNLSIGFCDPELWRLVEPGTPSPQARLRVCRALADAGIGRGVLMAPILPHLSDSDEQLESAVAELAAAGAHSVTPIVLHLRPGAREWFFGWLRTHRPELVDAYERLYAHGAYAPKSYQRSITDRVASLTEKYGIAGVSASSARGAAPTSASVAAPDSEPHPSSSQLSLLEI